MVKQKRKDGAPGAIAGGSLEISSMVLGGILLMLSGSPLKTVAEASPQPWKSVVYAYRDPANGEASLRAYNTGMQDINLVVVQTYGSRPEADLAKGALENAGIRAMIQADTAGGMREHLAWSGAGFHILVREEDATVARDVLTPPDEGIVSSDADFQIDDDPRPSWRRFT